MNHTIRKGKPADIPKVYELIKELAIVEKAEDQLANTPEQLLEDGFGDTPAYELIVAEVENEIVGIALYFFHYSTWKGKFLYLEDLVVTHAHRGKGIGKHLLDSLVAIAKEQGANRVGWQVLDWNTPAIDFYKSLGAVFDGEWLNCKIWVKEYLESQKGGL